MCQDVHCCLSQANRKPVPIPGRTRSLPAAHFGSRDVPGTSHVTVLITAKTIFNPAYTLHCYVMIVSALSLLEADRSWCLVQV